MKSVNMRVHFLGLYSTAPLLCRTVLKSKSHENDVINNSRLRKPLNTEFCNFCKQHMIHINGPTDTITSVPYLRIRANLSASEVLADNKDRRKENYA